ncbi:RNA polymerase factor sigma-54 [Erythrobacter sp. YT30]|uniref:RNA polymerase factor sigma-54 n=1 Tax=Erythrobacter sp. YT30 TaxID=1735012 RepID=UPI00076D55A0|nr:RNA polymerase factor sigma-54 [Erythrobacter sp. YT30]KWV91214.1 RNA polymerase sigma-54 factor [Erythrobacter sp. YT30]
MALGPRLDLRQSQSLVMTPQLQQAIKLLAASNLEIETFIGEALETNPLLEVGETRSENADAPSEPDDIPREEFTSDQLMAQGQGETEAPLDIDNGALDRDVDTGDGAQSLRANADWSAAGTGMGAASELPDFEATQSAELSLGDHLRMQVGAAASSEREAFIATHLIGMLDDAGWLPFDLRDIAYDLGVDLASAERALKVVQSLDPSGVGARDLAECLTIQAREADRYDPCMERLIDNLDLLARGEVERLKRMCRVDDEDFADMLRELRSYDPKPGLAFASEGGGAVVPDILLSDNGKGGWDIALNEDTLPRLVVNRDYYVEVGSTGQSDEAKAWLKEKLADAHWLIRALDQRQKTILKTAAEIVKQQDGFFRRGVSELRPLTLREVAEQIEMHESTVSRVTSNKYLHCERGCFELKYFFSSGVGKIGGSGDGEGASSQAIKARIKALTDAEDPKKVLSDQKLVDILNEEGFDLARRTVAKYREAAGIGSSAQRRRQKKLESL